MEKTFTLLTLITLLSSSALRAQVGVGTTTPNASSILDVYSTTTGFLMPRLSSIQRAAIASPAAGLQVYDITTKSIWYFNGTIWTEFSNVKGWSKTGDAATSEATNFIGTTDNIPFTIKVNNLLAGKLNWTKNLAFFGTEAGSNTTASNNSAFGSAALYSNTTGRYNIAVGSYALVSNTTSNSNIAIGDEALYDTTGNTNTGVGDSVLWNNTSGSFNTALGALALSSNTSGSRNTALGTYAGPSASALNNTTAIGYNATVSRSNSMVLGGTGTDAVNVGINTTAPTSKLQVVGLQVFANDTAAGAAGLTTGAFYIDSNGFVKAKL